jgi:hypothetical protein
MLCAAAKKKSNKSHQQKKKKPTKTIRGRRAGRPAGIASGTGTVPTRDVSTSTPPKTKKTPNKNQTKHNCSLQKGVCTKLIGHEC